MPDESPTNAQDTNTTNTPNPGPSQPSADAPKGHGSRNAVAIIVTIIILCFIGFLVWLFGFSGKANNNPATNTVTTNSGQPTTAQTEATIKNNWQEFFSGATPASRKVELLENGQQFAQVIDEMAATPAAKEASATVTKVSLTSASKATVTYSVGISKTEQLPNQTGQAVLQNGTWKVSTDAFCGLLQLEGNVPPACPGGSSSQSESSSSTSATSSSAASSTTSTPSSTTKS